MKFHIANSRDSHPGATQSLALWTRIFTERLQMVKQMKKEATHEVTTL